MTSDLGGSLEGVREVARDSEHRLRAVTIGKVPRLDGPINLVDYDPTWADLFRGEALRLQAILGDRLLRVEHVGSTSVPGLCAKPIVDIVLVVADSSDEAAYLPDLEAAGYILRIREPDWYQHRVLKGPDININVHVFSTACAEVDRMVRLRDRLRDDDADRALYERTKRALARRQWAFVQDYADAKGAVIEAILARSPADGS